MKDNVEYKIVSSDSTDFMGNRVSKLMSEGWVLYGSPYFNSQKESNCQAMVRHPKTKEILND